MFSLSASYILTFHLHHILLHELMRQCLLLPYTVSLFEVWALWRIQKTWCYIVSLDIFLFQTALTFGLVTVAMAYVTGTMDQTLVQITFMSFGMTGGPLLGLFLLAMFCPCANAWVSTCVLVTSVVLFGCWVVLEVLLTCSYLSLHGWCNPYTHARQVHILSTYNKIACGCPNHLYEVQHEKIYISTQFCLEHDQKRSWKVNIEGASFETNHKYLVIQWLQLLNLHVNLSIHNFLIIVSEVRVLNLSISNKEH